MAANIEDSPLDGRSNEFVRILLTAMADKEQAVPPMMVRVADTSSSFSVRIKPSLDLLLIKFLILRMITTQRNE